MGQEDEEEVVELSADASRPDRVDKSCQTCRVTGRTTQCTKIKETGCGSE
ncbi:MAG: hypothetical protein WCS30_06265 [Selenomonadaceae bacterium]